MTPGGLSSVSQESWGSFFGSPPLCGVTQSPNPLSSTFVPTNLCINHYVLSLGTKLVSGGDGITVELFQIPKDDAVKVLHSVLTLDVTIPLTGPITQSLTVYQRAENKCTHHFIFS